MSFGQDTWNAFAAQNTTLRGVFDEWDLRWTLGDDRLSIEKIIHNTEAQLAALRANAQRSPRRRKGPRDAHGS